MIIRNAAPTTKYETAGEAEAADQQPVSEPLQRGGQVVRDINVGVEESAEPLRVGGLDAALGGEWR